MISGMELFHFDAFAERPFSGACELSAARSGT
jgi:hypothetical protein